MEMPNAEPLPRIAPLRLSTAAQHASGPWALRAEIEHAAKQRRVPAIDLLVATDRPQNENHFAKPLLDSILLVYAVTS